MKRFTTILALIALTFAGFTSPATAAPVQPAAKVSQVSTLKITEAKRSDQQNAGWATLDYVFNKSPKTAAEMAKVGNRVSYVGTSATPVSMLPLVSFRGKSAGGKMTNHVFVFTKAAKHTTIPAYQYARLAAALPLCKTEDANVCKWDAAKQGNGKGRSFIALNDFTVILKK